MAALIEKNFIPYSETLSIGFCTLSADFSFLLLRCITAMLFLVRGPSTYDLQFLGRVAKIP